MRGAPQCGPGGSAPAPSRTAHQEKGEPYPLHPRFVGCRPGREPLGAKSPGSQSERCSNKGSSVSVDLQVTKNIVFPHEPLLTDRHRARPGRQSRHAGARRGTPGHAGARRGMPYQLLTATAHGQTQPRPSPTLPQGESPNPKTGKPTKFRILRFCFCVFGQDFGGFGT